MKKVIRRVYSNDFAESSSDQNTNKPRKRKRLLAVAGGIAAAGAAGAGAYYARNTKAGMAVRNAARNVGAKAEGYRGQAARAAYKGMDRAGLAARNVGAKAEGYRGQAARAVYDSANKARNTTGKIVKKFKK